jgi:hypothetical protein
LMRREDRLDRFRHECFRWGLEERDDRDSAVRAGECPF